MATFRYTDQFHNLIETCATNSGICNFKTFMFGKPEEINFDHNIDFGDYTNAYNVDSPDNTNSHDLCSLGYPSSIITDVSLFRHHWQFDIYACRLLSDSIVKTFTKAQNFAGLDLKIWNMLQAFNSCQNKVLDSRLTRDYGLFNDKLMVVRASLQWQLESDCTPTEITDEICED